MATARYELKSAREQPPTQNIKDEPRHIIQAASSMVSAANAKLRKTEQELEALKKTLENERRAHKQTRRQFEAVTESTKQSQSDK